MRIEKFIYFTTTLSIFTESARFNIGFDLKLFYFIILINFLFLTHGKKIKYPIGLLVFHSIIIFSGVFSILFGYNKIGYFLIQLFFLILIPVYYYSFFRLFENKFREIVFLYCKLSFWIAIIGIIKYPYDLIQSYGLHSIMLEPAHYCTIILPAFFITFKNINYPRYYYKIILITIILSGSILGYIGLGLALIFFSKKISFVKTSFSIFFAFFLGAVLYNIYQPFKLRFDDTISSLSSGNLSKVNLSTYSLVSNYFVSKQSFISNPILGNGVGSHTISRSFFLRKIEGIEMFEDMGMDHLNAQDAGSLLLRIISELGLLGVFSMLFFIIKFYVPGRNNSFFANSYISKGIMIYFILKLIREGHYFSPEMYFFVFIYVFNNYEISRKTRLIH